MGGDAYRKSVHNCTFVHHHNDGIRQVFQTVYVHGYSTYTAIYFCWAAHAVCLEGAIIVLACIIFSLFASSPPVVDADAAPAAMVWKYIGELVFNMLVLVGAVKMSDRIVREMMGL